MDIFNFCWVTLLDESKKSNVFFDKNTCNVKNDIDENFNKPINRISYLYKFGSYNISLFHQCFKEFFTKAPDSSKIIDKFRSMENPTICSMSSGPGIDIIGLLYSLYIVNKPLVNPIAFKIISRHGAWRTVVTEMLSSSIISVPDSSSCKLIECDFLKELSKKAQSCLKEADVLLMCNSFSSSVIPEKAVCNTLKNVVQLLKPGALVFSIVHKEKSAFFKELGSLDSFLYGPVEVTLENMPYNEKIIELVGVKPLCAGSCLFAVWQKLHDIKCETENSLSIGSNLPSSTTKLLHSKGDVKNISYPILNISNLRREFSSESIASSSQFSSSSISSPILKRKDNPAVSGNSIKIPEQNIVFSKNNFAKTTSTSSLSTSDSENRKKCVLPCESGFKNKEKNNGNNINSLLKNMDYLVTKLEGLIISNDLSKNTFFKEKQSSNYEHHHQNMNQDCCRCSARQCQFNGKNLACCPSVMCYGNNNVGSRNCLACTPSNSHRTLPQESPCIVIPIQNLSNESLAQILSLISQNTSSENKTASNLFLKKES